LVLTCTGTGSRNHSYGFAIGRGAISALSDDAPVVEGVATAPALLQRAPDVDLPICRAVADLVAGRVSLHDAMATALARKLRDE
jgi:glycerol-3-phosphate dehydrogenase (NAD(P)+)